MRGLKIYISCNSSTSFNRQEENQEEKPLVGTRKRKQEKKRQLRMRRNDLKTARILVEHHERVSHRLRNRENGTYE